MEHYLKYYKEIESSGHVWRVEIHQESEAAFNPIEIGPVLQELKLVLQGDQADIDTPIVKTSMEMMFVDAPDLEESRKCGYWEEFYTSSSTEYMVLLFKDGIREWSGFITPDSFSESLQYRGGVSIIARDNLGTLRDIDFDMNELANIDGKVTVREVINRAFGESSCRLELRYDDSAFPKALDIVDAYSNDGNTLLAQYVDVLALADINWYEALTIVLESIGAVMRYVGNNILLLMPLRAMPKFGQRYWADIKRRDVTFRAFGNRELLPGIKRIQEIDEFNIDNETRNEIIPKYDGQSSTIICDNMILRGPTTTLVGPFDTRVSGYRDPSRPAFIAPEYSSLLNVSELSKVEGEDSEEYGQWDDNSIIYFAVNTTQANSIKFIRGVHTTSGKLSIRFTAAKPVSLLPDFSAVMNTPIASASTYGTDPFLRYRLIYKSSTRTLYYETSTSAWKTANVVNVAPLSSGLFSADKPLPKTFELKDIETPGVGEVTLEIIDIQIITLDLTLRKDCVGMYMRLKDIGIDLTLPEDISILEKLTINTEYSDRYSVQLSRYPQLAIVPTSLPEVAYVPNAIISKCTSQYRSAEQWAWNQKEQGITLQRLIHQQLLAYHASPNNILTGELVTDDPIFDAIYEWGGKEHILVSGKLNIISGSMESAMLREFYRYDHMWEIWPEQDAVEASSFLTEISLLIHTNRVISRTEISLPNWITFVGMTTPVGGVVTLNLEIMPNLTEAERVAYISIATAKVKITQYP